VSLEGSEDVVELSEGGKRKREEGGEEEWWIWEMRNWGKGENGEKGRRARKRGNGKVARSCAQDVEVEHDAFAKHLEFLPIIISDTSSRKAGLLGFGYVISEPIIERLEGAFLCFVENILDQSSLDCDLHSTMISLERGAAEEPLNCLSQFKKCNLDRYKEQALQERAIAIAN